MNLKTSIVVYTIATILAYLFATSFTSCSQPNPPDCSQKDVQIKELTVKISDLKDELLVSKQKLFDCQSELPDTVFLHDTLYLPGIEVPPDTITINDTIYVPPVDTIVSFPISIEIPIDSIRVDSIYKPKWDNPSDFYPSNMIDGTLFHSKEDRGKRWSVPGYPHQAMFYFDSVYVITEIWINSWGWNEGYTHTIDIYSYADKIKTITTKPELWSKHFLQMVSSHLYLDVKGGKNNWTDIAEIKIFGYKEQ